MNYARWTRCTDRRRLLSKFGEEVGEVFKADCDRADAMETKAGTPKGRARLDHRVRAADKNLIEELDHVIFMASRLKKVVADEMVE